MSPTLVGGLHYIVFKIPFQPKPTCAFVFIEMDDPNRWHYLTDTHSMSISVKAKHMLKIMLKDSKKRFVVHLSLPCLVHIDCSGKPLHEHQEVHGAPVFQFLKGTNQSSGQLASKLDTLGKPRKKPPQKQTPKDTSKTSIASTSFLLLSLQP